MGNTITDDEMLQDLQMLPEGGKQVCTNLLVLLNFSQEL